MSERPDPSAETYDTWFEILAHGLRRRLLFELSRRSHQSATLSVPEDVLRPEEDADRIHLHFRHVHLPKLVEEDLVTWDRETDTVSSGSAFDRIVPLLEAIEPVGECDAGTR
ncbi:hypothetical protein [Halobaculum lipolyticum]|uniref:ArsR family transcriptional regulator n=1 Tax=Halobaculum lipolyticum TaxID=3032001 RepID=A0ABD5WE24_9EURY|nr:hypothetical protein [Halobaculum sp. DT31]